MAEFPRKLNEEGAEEDIGFILWKLESIDKFYPCYKTMLKKD